MFWTCKCNPCKVMITHQELQHEVDFRNLGNSDILRELQNWVETRPNTQSSLQNWIFGNSGKSGKSRYQSFFGLAWFCLIFLLLAKCFVYGCLQKKVLLIFCPNFLQTSISWHFAWYWWLSQVFDGYKKQGNCKKVSNLTVFCKYYFKCLV